MFDFKKAMELKKQMEEMTGKLDAILVDGESGQTPHTVKVTVTANRDVKDITISPELMVPGNAAQVEDLIISALNKAIEKAKGVAETEARAMALGGKFPGL
jgi:DNA-binding protein YbaB